MSFWSAPRLVADGQKEAVAGRACLLVLLEGALGEFVAALVAALAKKWDGCAWCEVEYARGRSNAVVADP
jgi:hypothetical protein